MNVVGASIHVHSLAGHKNATTTVGQLRNMARLVGTGGGGGGGGIVLVSGQSAKGSKIPSEYRSNMMLHDSVYWEFLNATRSNADGNNRYLRYLDVYQLTDVRCHLSEGSEPYFPALCGEPREFPFSHASACFLSLTSSDPCPTLLLQSCYMENCSSDGGHRARFVNRWKAQLLLNLLCEYGGVGGYYGNDDVEDAEDSASHL